MSSIESPTTVDTGAEFRLQKIKQARVLADIACRRHQTICNAKKTARLERLEGKLEIKQKDCEDLQALIDARKRVLKRKNA